MTPTEKLVQQVGRALTEKPDRLALERLAAEYVAQCQAAGRRLEQCDTMLATGNHYQASQLAETPSPLLDQIAALSFDRAEQWRSFCRANGLPAAEPFDERAISKLNDLYQKGITAQHPLYREYRDAVLKRDEERALKVLRTIVKLNKSDDVAKGECARLEQKLRERKLAALESILAKGEPAVIMEQLGQLEALFPVDSLSGAAVGQARSVRRQYEAEQARRRCEELIVSLAQTREASDWRRAVELGREMENLCRTHQLVLPADKTKQFQQIRTWASGLQGRFEAEQRYQEGIQQLRRLAEAPPRGSRRSTAAGLREELACLSAKRTEVELSGRAIPEELALQLSRRAGNLQVEIKRRDKQRVMAAVASAAIGCALLVFLVFQIFHAMRVAKAAGEVAKLIAEGQLLEARAYFDRLETNLLSTTRLEKLRADLDRIVAEDERRHGEVLRAVVQLEEYQHSQFTNASATPITNLIQQVVTGIPQLVAASRGDLEERVTLVKAAYERTLQQQEKEQRNRREQRQGEVRKLWLQAKTASEPLRGTGIAVGTGISLAQLRQKIQEIEGSLQKAGSLIAGDEAMQQEKEEQEQDIRNNYAQFKLALDTLDKAEMGMKRAATLEEYGKALAQYTHPRVPDVLEVQSAQVLSTLSLNLTDLSQQLLMPGDPEAWKQFKANPQADLYPDDIKDEEGKKFVALRDDDSFKDISRYELPAGTVATPPIAGEIYARGPIEVKGVIKTPSAVSFSLTWNAFVPNKDSSRVVFAKSTHRCELQNPPAGWTGEPTGGRTTESALFARLDLGDLVDAQANKFRKPLLPVLDEVRAAPDIHPLYRAYLHYQLLELMNERPNAWGMQWSPSLRAHQRQLKSLRAAELRSGDWLLPRRDQQYGEALRDFYRTSAGVSYTKEARLYQGLVRKAEEAGLSYAGYLGLDGQAVLRTEAPRAGELWGLTATNQWSRLFRFNEEKPQPIAGAKPRPFTPLVAWPGDRAAIQREAAKEAGYETGTPPPPEALPPLLR